MTVTTETPIPIEPMPDHQIPPAPTGTTATVAATNLNSEGTAPPTCPCACCVASATLAGTAASSPLDNSSATARSSGPRVDVRSLAPTSSEEEPLASQHDDGRYLEPSAAETGGVQMQSLAAAAETIEAQSFLTKPVEDAAQQLVQHASDSLNAIIKRRTNELFDVVVEKLTGTDSVGGFLPDPFNIATSADLINSEGESILADVRVIVAEFTPPIVDNVLDALAKRGASKDDNHCALRRVLNATVPARMRRLVVAAVRRAVLHDIAVDSEEEANKNRKVRFAPTPPIENRSA